MASVAPQGTPPMHTLTTLHAKTSMAAATPTAPRSTHIKLVVKKPTS